MPKVELKVGPSGLGTVTVDGQDMSNIVRQTTIYSSAGEATRVELEVIAVDVDAFAEAEVTYRVFVANHFGEGATPRKAVENLLAQMPENA